MSKPILIFGGNRIGKCMIEETLNAMGFVYVGKSKSTQPKYEFVKVDLDEYLTDKEG